MSFFSNSQHLDLRVGGLCIFWVFGVGILAVYAIFASPFNAPLWAAFAFPAMGLAQFGLGIAAAFPLGGRQ